MSPVTLIVSGILFFLVGMAFGYSLGPPLMWVPLVFPVIMALGAAIAVGPTILTFILLLVALAITFLGIVLGQRAAPEQDPREAPG
jgi:hypothetical protein